MSTCSVLIISTRCRLRVRSCPQFWTRKQLYWSNAAIFPIETHIFLQQQYPQCTIAIAHDPLFVIIGTIHAARMLDASDQFIATVDWLIFRTKCQTRAHQLEWKFWGLAVHAFSVQQCVFGRVSSVVWVNILRIIFFLHFHHPVCTLDLRYLFGFLFCAFCCFAFCPLPTMTTTKTQIP